MLTRSLETHNPALNSYRAPIQTKDHSEDMEISGSVENSQISMCLATRSLCASYFSIVGVISVKGVIQCMISQLERGAYVVLLQSLHLLYTIASDCPPCLLWTVFYPLLESQCLPAILCSIHPRYLKRSKKKSKSSSTPISPMECKVLETLIGLLAVFARNIRTLKAIVFGLHSGQFPDYPSKHRSKVFQIFQSMSVSHKYNTENLDSIFDMLIRSIVWNFMDGSVSIVLSILQFVKACLIACNCNPYSTNLLEGDERIISESTFPHEYKEERGEQFYRSSIESKDTDKSFTESISPSFQLCVFTTKQLGEFLSKLTDILRRIVDFFSTKEHSFLLDKISPSPCRSNASGSFRLSFPDPIRSTIKTNQANLQEIISSQYTKHEITEINSYFEQYYQIISREIVDILGIIIHWKNPNVCAILYQNGHHYSLVHDLEAVQDYNKESSLLNLVPTSIEVCDTILSFIREPAQRKRV